MVVHASLGVGWPRGRAWHSVSKREIWALQAAAAATCASYGSGGGGPCALGAVLYLTLHIRIYLLHKATESMLVVVSMFAGGSLSGAPKVLDLIFGSSDDPYCWRMA